jgi:hypothetical protein
MLARRFRDERPAAHHRQVDGPSGQQEKDHADSGSHHAEPGSDLAWIAHRTSTT